MTKTKRYIATLSYALLICFALTFLSAFHWTFALLTHFYLQIGFFALLTVPFLIRVNKSYILAACMAVITIFCYVQTRFPMQNPWVIAAPQASEDSGILRIAQYNKYHKNKKFEFLTNWVKTNDIDILVMQEVTRHDLKGLNETLLNVLPYTLPTMKHRPGYATVFSKYPLEDLLIHHICDKACPTGGIRFKTTLPDGQTVTIYTVHADTPIKSNHYKAQKTELLHAGKWIREGDAKNKIFIGDINTTPYSPPFKTLIKESSLNYQFYGLLPANTWPSFLILPVLKIPIDHVLFSDSLTLLDLRRDQSHGSDHHSLVATFAVE